MKAFFDLVNDPGETVNQAYNPEYKALVEKHRKHLSDWNLERSGYLTKELSEW